MVRNNFLEQIRQTQAAKQPAPESKPIAQMSEAEAKRLRAEIRRTEEEIHLAREDLARRRTTLGDVLRSKRRRRSWK